MSVELSTSSPHDLAALERGCWGRGVFWRTSRVLGRGLPGPCLRILEPSGGIRYREASEVRLTEPER
jgi:hypothetical protein